MERRKADRLKLKPCVFYRVYLHSHWIGPVNLNNIGGLGLRFTNEELIQNKTTLMLKIDLLDGENPIILQGDVVWHKKSPPLNKYHIGVKFRRMQHKDRQRFVKYICENILDQYLNDKGKVVLK